MLKRTASGKYQRYTDNVMKPINWVVSFIELLFMSGVLFGPSFWIQILSAVLLVKVLLIYFGIYIYWMLSDPNRLQSEGYNLEVLEVHGLSDALDPKINIKNKESTIKVTERD